VTDGRDSGYRAAMMFEIRQRDRSSRRGRCGPLGALSLCLIVTLTVFSIKVSMAMPIPA
jgi:hypothetical protein